MHGWGTLDEDAKRIENAETSRLAVCNCDWDKISASDLFGISSWIHLSCLFVMIYT